MSQNVEEIKSNTIANRTQKLVTSFYELDAEIKLKYTDSYDKGTKK
jgi:hypothetical protein